ncbi:MAG: PfkB family carbohydrate kinase [Ferruginibacter sp.]
MNFDELFQSFSNIKIAVLGDAMLDTYWWGNTERISPEAPVPVVSVSKKEQRIGGAGNVALNLASLGCPVQMITVLGNDEEAGILEKLLAQNNISTGYVLKSDHRVTTNKIRIISRNQHMMRLDAEITKPISAAEEDALLKNFEKYIETEKPAIVILEDYNKGILTEKVITTAISLCKKNKVLTAVDPKRKNFFAYKGADIFKPNLKEAKEGLNIIGDELSAASLEAIHLALHARLQHDTSFITLSEKGVYYQGQNEKEWIPTHVRSIADVSGAGDTVIAVAALVFAATKNRKLMAEVANIAGGLVCEEVGTVAIDKEKLLNECRTLIRG